MTLLEVIQKASSTRTTVSNEDVDFPIVLNPDPIFPQLLPETDCPKSEPSLRKFTGWEISNSDLELIKISEKFVKKLRRKLKNTNSFRRNDFLEMLCSHLVKIGEKIGVSVEVNKSEERYACKLVDRLGNSVGRNVKTLILEACIVLEVWDVLGSLISNSLIEHSSISTLVHDLIEKRRSELIVLCVKHLLDLQTYELLCILKYFLCTPNDGYENLIPVRDDWETQSLIAIEKASGKGLSGADKILAKDAALLIMLAYDGFSVTELCLHCLLASKNFDEVIFAACIGKLNGEEIKALIHYLGKWLRKYEKFPQVGPCPTASAALELKICDWIPTLESIVKCLGLVVDEHFSSLLLHSDFHEDLMSFEGVVSSLAAEATQCRSLEHLMEKIKNQP